MLFVSASAGMPQHACLVGAFGQHAWALACRDVYYRTHVQELDGSCSMNAHMGLLVDMPAP